MLVVHALEQMERNRRKPISVLSVVNGERRLLSLLRLHDLIQAGLHESPDRAALVGAEPTSVPIRLVVLDVDGV